MKSWAGLDRSDEIYGPAADPVLVSCIGGLRLCLRERPGAVAVQFDPGYPADLHVPDLSIAKSYDTSDRDAEDSAYRDEFLPERAGLDGVSVRVGTGMPVKYWTVPLALVTTVLAVSSVVLAWMSGLPWHPNPVIPAFFAGAAAAFWQKSYK